MNIVVTKSHNDVIAQEGIVIKSHKDVIAQEGSEIIMGVSNNYVHEYCSSVHQYM